MLIGDHGIPIGFPFLSGIAALEMSRASNQVLVASGDEWIEELRLARFIKNARRFARSSRIRALQSSLGVV